MNVSQSCGVSFKLDGIQRHGDVHIEEQVTESKPRYRAVIDSVPLRGTFGGYSEDVTLALDFLNLAMQAKGADEIVFSNPAD